jgi:hypothetical protein
MKKNNIVTQIKEALLIKRSLAVDIVYDNLDDFLLEKDFTSADDLIRKIAVENFPLSIFLSALIISNPWKQELKEARLILIEACNKIKLKNLDFVD